MHELLDRRHNGQYVYDVQAYVLTNRQVGPTVCVINVTIAQEIKFEDM